MEKLTPPLIIFQTATPLAKTSCYKFCYLQVCSTPPPFFGHTIPLLKLTVCVTSQVWDYWTQIGECIVIQRQLVLTLIPWLARIAAQRQTVIIVQACAGASWPFNRLWWILILDRIFHENNFVWNNFNDYNAGSHCWGWIGKYGL